MKIKVPLKIIELEEGNFHLIVVGIFEDGETVNWVIDTGASKTVFDKTLSEKYTILDDETEEVHSAGIGEKPLETSAGRLKKFHLGKLKISSLKVAILDLSHINDLYSKATDLKIGGLIGSDFLLKYKAVIDYRKKKLILIDR